MFFLVVLAFYRFLCLIKQKVFHGIIKLFHKWSVRWRGLVTGKLACKTLVSVSCNVCSCTKREAFLIHLNRSCNWILWQDQPHKQSGSRLRHVRLLVLPSWWWKVHHNECLTFTKHLGTKKSSIMHQSIPAAPSTPPGLLRGICPPCQSRGWGICKFCAAWGPGIGQPRGHSWAFDTHAVCYQKITTQRILLGKKADWLICQGQEKLKRFVKACSWFYACISSLLINLCWRD